MGTLQRILLILFAFLVLFSGSSYESWSYLQLFLAATLLFFGLSPVTWFHRKVPIAQQIPPSLESNQENLQSDVEDEELRELPTIGFLTSEKLLLLKSLVKLRSAEIGNIYLKVRQYQKEAKDGNWVLLFMKERAVFDLYEPYTNVEKEDQEKAEAKAIAVSTLGII